jgi:hypothetical protein
MRTRREAVAWARGQIDRPSKDYTRLCLQFVRLSFDLPPVEPDAGRAWDNAKRKHATSNPGAIPFGVPVFWELSSEADHVALSIGGGLCISTDVKRTGRADVVRIASITSGWNGKLLGWTEDLNGFPVYRKAAIPNNVQRAREHMKTARTHIDQAVRYLANTPEHRTVAHGVQADLAKLSARVDAALKEVPKR